MFQARPSPRFGRGSSGGGSKGGSQAIPHSPHTSTLAVVSGEIGVPSVGRAAAEGHEIACQTEQVLLPLLTVHEQLLLLHDEA